ncbi:NUDIX domain-containing protein [Roseivirga sp. BDSF3-8]|uniref:NUDIX domain-containing protein n=1 Tax=Roseivirga sp. BDSF3-8 TaxID=3241598 RepID=UPI003531C432
MSKKRVGEVFGDRLRVRVCGICLMDGGLLLTEHKGLGPQGRLWIPPGGGMQYGESAEECLVRELKEETGLEIAAGKLLFVHEYINAPLHALELFYEAKITGGSLTKGIDPELAENEQIIQQSKFMGQEEIEGLNKELRHEILKRYTDPKDITGLRGYFRFR